jgi:hypothetical protein
VSQAIHGVLSETTLAELRDDQQQALLEQVLAYQI